MTRLGHWSGRGVTVTVLTVTVTVLMVTGLSLLLNKGGAATQLLSLRLPFALFHAVSSGVSVAGATARWQLEAAAQCHTALLQKFRTPIEGSQVPGCLTPRRAHILTWWRFVPGTTTVSAFIPIGDTGPIGGFPAGQESTARAAACIISGGMRA